MLDPKIIDDFVKRLSAAIPPSLQQVRADLEHNFRGILQSGFAKLDIVSREEFDAQMNVLARTRAKVDALQEQVALLERQLLKQPTSGDEPPLV